MKVYGEEGIQPSMEARGRRTLMHPPPNSTDMAQFSKLRWSAEEFVPFDSITAEEAWELEEVDEFNRELVRLEELEMQQELVRARIPTLACAHSTHTCAHPTHARAYLTLAHVPHRRAPHACPLLCA